MNNRQPPRLPLALLRRFIGDNEPLVGDLIEEFETRKSRTWFWYQSILAVLIHGGRRSSDSRPLRLADGHGAAFTADRPRYDVRVRRFYLGASPVAGVGGLGMVALAVLVTVVAPQTWWVVAATIAGGVLLGLGLVIVSRRRLAAGPRAGSANGLIGDRSALTRDPGPRPASRAGTE